MLLRYSVVAAVLLAVASPALAADYYIAKDPDTGKCKVVTKKPEDAEMVGAAYTSKEAAKAAKKAAKASGECKSAED